MRVHELIAHKSSQDVVTISPNATVRELISLLARFNIGALVVSTDGVVVTGIVSERDVVRRLNEDPHVLDATVATIMTTDVHTTDPTEHVNELMQLMTEHRIRHLPVVQDGALKGIISIGDVVKSRMGELEFERDQLDKFVHSQQT